MSTEAEDARHNTPFKPNHFVHDSLGDPVTCTEDHNHPQDFPLPPLFTRQHLADPQYAPTATSLNAAASMVEAFKGTELSFSFQHTGGVFTRLARAESSDFDGLELIDLRVLRTHLDEAMFLVNNAIARHERELP